MSNAIVSKNDIIKLRFNEYGKNHEVLVRAVKEFELDQLLDAIEIFSNTNVNSKTMCENVNCQQSYTTFDPCYELCPYCGQTLSFEFVAPTVWQFLLPSSNSFVKVVNSEDIYISNLTYF